MPTKFFIIIVIVFITGFLLVGYVLIQSMPSYFIKEPVDSSVTNVQIDFIDDNLPGK